MILHTLALTLILTACVQADFAPTPVHRVAFTKFAPPAGWHSLHPARIRPRLRTQHAGWEHAEHFRGYIEHVNAFELTLPISPGRYLVRFGLLDSIACAVGSRVFRFEVAGRSSGDIDIFQVAGCAKPMEVELLATVEPGERLVVKAQRVAGSHGPLLTNLQVFRYQNIQQSLPVSISMVGGLKVAFASTGSLQPGYTAFNPANVHPQEFEITSIKSGPLPYRDSLRIRPIFTYTQPLANGNYSVRLGFMETSKGCVIGQRVFSVQVGDQRIPSLDVFSRAGCELPYDLLVPGVVVTNGELILSFSRIQGYAPFLSNFEVTADSTDSSGPNSLETDNGIPDMAGEDDQTASDETNNPANPVISGSADDSRYGQGISEETMGDERVSEDVDLMINIGPEGSAPGSRRSSFSGTINGLPSGIPATFFKTFRYGKEFNYSFDLQPGAYDITMGFVETYQPNCVEPGKRVFSVFVNGVVQLEGYDIYSQGGCYRVLLEQLKGITVGAVDTEPLTIRFLAVANFAQVAYIGIKSASKECVPDSLNGMSSSDHAAHAVPGSYPPQNNINSPLSYVDRDGDGFFTVNIDGKRSHTHFFDTENGIIGRITKYEWTILETGEVLSDKVSFKHDFRMGTTRIKLTVLDNSCTTDSAETTVTVTGKIQPGQLCYYYPGLTSLPAGGTLGEDPSPAFLAISKSLDLGFPQFPFSEENFVARCMFFLDHIGDPKDVLISVPTGGSGIARVYKGEDLILDTETFSSAITPISTGLTAFEVIYTHSGASTPQMAFQVDGSVPANALVRHDQSTVLPILTSLSPSESEGSGGAKVKVNGYGLYLPLNVTFGSETVKVSSMGASSSQFFVTSPPSSVNGAVDVVVQSAGGFYSNALQFSYGETQCDNPSFETKALRSNVGGVEKDLDLKLPSCAVLGPDKNIYLGTLGGSVQVLGYDPITLKATSQCSSERITDSHFRAPDGSLAKRWILGIAFDPREKDILPYVSTSTLFWKSKNNIEDTEGAAWRNGAVDRMKLIDNPASFIIGKSSGQCVAYDRRIVSNLPVSNRDHSVNGLLFTQNGDLLIAVGGNTNSGLPGWKLGYLWETELSGAVLIAKLSLGMAFDGDIQYSDDNVHYLAKKVSGDVDVYAAGMRNMYVMTMASDGEIYGTDNGPNCSFGLASIECDEFSPVRAANYSMSGEVDWPSGFRPGSTACAVGPSRKDKVLHIVPGKYYGHPNLQRGDSAQCAYIDPYDDKTLGDKDPPAKYQAPITVIPSAVTGIGEYGASHFCGKLRGELLLTTYKTGPTYRMKTMKGRLITSPDALSQTAGIQFVEDIHGNLVFPKLTAKKVGLLTPKVRVPSIMSVVGVWPRRHGRNGGTKLFIGGFNFGTDASVLVGGRPCPITAGGISEREIECTVPGLAVGDRVHASVKVILDGVESELSNAVLYTNR